MNGRQVPTDAPSDPGRGGLDRIPGKMRVPGSRLHLRMTEQFPDHREALAQGQRPRCIPVPQIVKMDIVQDRPGANLRVLLNRR